MSKTLVTTKRLLTACYDAHNLTLMRICCKILLKFNSVWENLVLNLFSCTLFRKILSNIHTYVVFFRKSLFKCSIFRTFRRTFILM